jgi:hypothetical protein
MQSNTPATIAARSGSIIISMVVRQLNATMATTRRLPMYGTRSGVTSNLSSAVRTSSSRCAWMDPIVTESKSKELATSPVEMCGIIYLKIMRQNTN